MSTRVYMLGFILSRMLNPVSYSVFLLYFVLIALGTGSIIPKASLQSFADIVSPLYVPFVLVSIIANGIALYFLGHFLYCVIVEGKYIVRLSTLGFLLAVSGIHIFTYFCMNALPNVTAVEQRVEFWFGQGFRLFEISSLLIMGIMLALYIGVLSREKFKKNIGFVDDTLPE